jgi:hypothetical protein
MADKLFGTADTGLINAAYKAAMANVPADLSGVYDKVVKSHGDFMSKVSESAEKLFADVEKYDQEMKDTFAPIYESMENGTYSDADVLSFEGELNGLRDEYKLIPKNKAGDSARLLWKSKVNKFKNDVLSMNQTLTNISYIVANEEHIALDNPEDAQFLAAIGRLHSGEEGLKATKTIKDGRIVYQVNIGGKVIEKNQEDIKKLVSPKDYTAISNLESALDLAKKMPSGGYTKYNGDGAAYIARNIYNTIKSAGNGKSRLDAYRTLANYRYAGGKTFREAIYQDDLLSSVLSTSLLTANLPDKFDVSGPDGKPDGKVDQTDLLNKENYNALADYILKTPDVGGQLLANWYAASEGSKIFDRANKAYKAKLAKENEEKNKKDDYGGFSYNQGETGGHPLSVLPDAQTGIAFDTKIRNRTLLLNRTSFPGIHFYYDIMQNEDGSYTANALNKKGGDIIIEDISGSDIAIIEGTLSSNDRDVSMFNFTTSSREDKERQENTPPPGTRGLSLKDLKSTAGARSFKNLIISKFNKNVLDDYDFEQVEGPSMPFTMGQTTDAKKVRIRSKDGKYDKTFNIGGDSTIQTVKEINLLFQDKYLRPINKGYETTVRG